MAKPEKDKKQVILSSKDSELKEHSSDIFDIDDKKAEAPKPKRNNAKKFFNNQQSDIQNDYANDSNNSYNEPTKAYNSSDTAFETNNAYNQQFTSSNNDTSTLNQNTDTTTLSEIPKDKTLEAYELLRDKAQANFDDINKQIANHQNNFEQNIIPQMDKNNQSSSINMTRLSFERNFEVKTDEFGNKKKHISYKPKVVTETTPNYSGKSKSNKYKVLSHRAGSSSLSAFAQESSQLAQIAAKKGVLHAAVALGEKVSIESSLDNNRPLKFAINSVKNAALGAETVAMKLSEKGTEGLLRAAKNELDRSGEDNDGYKAAKLVATITADTVSDIKTAVDYSKDKRDKDKARNNDKLREDFERKQEKLEFKREKAEYELNSAQNRVNKHQSKETDSELHEVNNVEFKEKSQVDLKEKEVVNPFSKKSHADIKSEVSSEDTPKPKKNRNKAFTHDEVSQSELHTKSQSSEHNNVKDTSSSGLHESDRVEFHDKTQVTPNEKSTVNPTSEKNYADMRSSNDFETTTTTNPSSFSKNNETATNSDSSTSNRKKPNLSKNTSNDDIPKSKVYNESKSTERQSPNNSKLHESDRVEFHEKSQVNPNKKTTVNPTIEKSHADVRSSDNKAPNLSSKSSSAEKSVSNDGIKPSFIQRAADKNVARIEAYEQRREARELSQQPHKYVAKMNKSVDPETGKIKRNVEISRKELTVNESQRGLIASTVHEIKGLARGELEFGGKKDPNLLSTMTGKVSQRAVSKGVMSLREKAMREGGNNDAVVAADKMVTIAKGTARGYDSAKNVIKPVADKAKSALYTAEKTLSCYVSAVSQAHTYNQSQLHSKKEDVQTKTESSNVKTYEKSDKSKENAKKKKKQGSESAARSETTQIKSSSKKRQYDRNRKKAFISFKDKETAKEVFKEAIKVFGEKFKAVAGGIGAVLLILIIVPMLLTTGGAGMTGGTATFGVVISPTEDNDLTLSEQYWTQLAENLIKQYRNYPTSHSGYDKYVANSPVTSLEHDTYKLLAYLSVKCKKDDGTWDFESAKDEIESIFAEQYEIFEQESVEIRNNVTTKTRTTDYYSFWLDENSQFPCANGYTYESFGYNGYAQSGVQIGVANWYTTEYFDMVGTDNGVKYEVAQSVQYNNLNTLGIRYVYQPSDGIYGVWYITEEYQEWYEYEYKTMEYGIREKKTFDSVIEERMVDFDEEQLEFYGFYTMFNLGHQTFSTPTKPFTVTDFAGYNTDITKTDGLDNSITVSTVAGCDIYAPCSGTITMSGNTCTIYNPTNKSKIIIEGITISVEDNKAVKKKLMGQAIGSDIKITVIDKDGQYQNPYLFIDWS